MRYRKRSAAISFLIGVLILVGVNPVASAETGVKPRSSSTTFQVECPPTIRCIAAPAAYADINGDVTNYGNYDLANRPKDMAITTIVEHFTEGSLQATLAEFDDPASLVSADYVVNTDGTVYQTVPLEDVAWHAGNWYYNMHAVGIEHVGFSANPQGLTPQQLYSSTQLTRWIALKNGIPLDRSHIIGHDNVPGVTKNGIASQHVDPGPFFPWAQYMALVGAPLPARGPIDSKFVTINALINLQLVTGCSNGVASCVPSGEHLSNFVYVHTAPNVNSTLITDPATGVTGTTDVSNDAARVFYGQSFALVEAPMYLEDGVWYHIWVQGTDGWVYSPYYAPTVSPAPTRTVYVTPNSNTSVAVYGRPVPEISAYPVAVLTPPSPGSFWIPTLSPQAPLPYMIQPGQRYVVADLNPPDDHFYAWSSDASFPYDHTDFKGTTRFIEINLGGRFGFVRASDVAVVNQ